MNEFLCSLCVLARQKSLDVPAISFMVKGETVLAVCHHLILAAADIIVEDANEVPETVH